VRILQIAPYFPPYLGGQERYVHHLSRELVRLGHEVLVVTSNVPRSSSTELIDGIRVIRHKCIARPLRNPITPGIIVPKKHLRDFDLIHAHNEHSFTANAAVFLKYCLKLPLVISCHGHGGSMFENTLADSFEHLYTATIGKATLKLADIVTVLSPSEQRFLCSLGVNKAKIRIIPLGVDLVTWAPYLNEINSSFLEKYRLKNKRVLLVVTQIIKRKGIDYLIKALPQIVESYPNIVCLIVGDGDYKAKAEQLVAELNLANHVRFTGFLQGPELAAAYKCAEIFVLPSLCEGQPICILEALLFSKPVVATDVGGVGDNFKDVSFLVSPQNSDELATTINRVLKDPEIGWELGGKGKALVESKFTWQRVAKDIVSVYEELNLGRKIGDL